MITFYSGLALSTNIKQTVLQLTTHCKLQACYNMYNYYSLKRRSSQIFLIKSSRISHLLTGCPTALGPLCFLLFCQFLLYQNTKIWWVLKNSGNLLSDRHQNFKNLWRNSWDNWHQRWHLSFRSWHFTIPQGQKNNFGVVGGNFDVNYLSYF